MATCVFKLEMNGAAINSGMGTCGLCGPIGVWTGWVAPSEAAVANGAVAIQPGAHGLDWASCMVCFVLPGRDLLGASVCCAAASAGSARAT